MRKKVGPLLEINLGSEIGVNKMKKMEQERKRERCQHLPLWGKRCQDDESPECHPESDSWLTETTRTDRRRRRVSAACTRPRWPVIRAPSSRQLLSGSRPDANMLIPLRWPFHWLAPTPVDTHQIDFPITPLRLKTAAVNMELPLLWWEQKQPLADCPLALDVTVSWCTAGSRLSQPRVLIKMALQWLDIMVKKHR